MATTRTERERHHRANLVNINRVQCLVGTADRTRIDHEGTLLERARLLEHELQAHLACEEGLDGLERLLLVIESGALPMRSAAIVEFLRVVVNAAPLPLDLLRRATTDDASDMLLVLNAWRIARVDLLAQVPGGARRVARAIRR